ncbi:MAG: hypothetical protein JXX29_03095 [Deltaproteobacteria bacterium]|nr:hypothetical protein [Deltaproteobacteria bacterium]MBN2670628.1 hypothetical protein [Deltaproteobacteria bacterium]
MPRNDTIRTYLFFISLVTICTISAVSAASVKNTQKTDVFFTLNGFGSSGSDMEGMSNQAVGFGWVARGGVRMNRLGLFVEAQRDIWLATETDVKLVNGVFNLGIGAHVIWINGRLKSTISTGTSTLAFDTIFDTAGTTGIYLDVHPTVLRWPLAKRITLELSPFGATLLIPAVSDPMLKRLEYRTTLGVEVTF